LFWLLKTFVYFLQGGVRRDDKYSFSKSVKKGFINLLFWGGWVALSFEKLFRVESEENKIWFESTDPIVGRQ
jgi:hypothetical protein